MTGKVQWREGVRKGVLGFALALAMGLTFIGVSTVCHAQAKAVVKVGSAKIREQASTSSEHIGSASNGESYTIVSQTQDSSGYTWYEISFDGSKKGYLRADTVTVNGDTVPVQNPSTPNVQEVRDIPAVTEGMEAVNPVSASVTGSITKIRADVSTASDSNVITKVIKGTALTVVGQKSDTTGKVWYFVNFAKDGREISGYIRSDFANPSAEITPVELEAEQPETNDIPQEPETEEVPKPVEVKDFDTQKDNGEWFLYDNVNGKKQSIQGLFDAAEQNAAAYEKAAKKVKSQKVVIVILVLLLVAACGAAGYLFMKMKDAVDQKFFDRVERDTLSKRRPSAGPRAAHQISRNLGGREPQRRPATPGQRPAAPGQRPAAPGQRPATPGQRPAGTGEPQRRPAAPGQRPAAPGQRPATSGLRPEGAGELRIKPAEPENKPMEKPKMDEVAETEQVLRDQSMKARSDEWKAKNFLADDDDDEFEFEFFNMKDEDL